MKIFIETIYIFIWNLIYSNRFNVKSGYCKIPFSVRKKIKKTKVKIKGHSNFLQVGDGAEIKNCEIRISGKNNKIILGENVYVRSGKIYLLDAENQTIIIDDNTTIEGAYFLVDENASITVGHDCMFSTDIILRTGDKHSILDMTTNERINFSKNIIIGNRVWIGRNVQVLKGATISDDSIVGTNSLVTKVFPETNCVIAGVPAKVVKRSVLWKRELVDK